MDDDSKFQCTICGRIGSVGRCCGSNTRIPLNDAARRDQRLSFDFDPSHDDPSHEGGYVVDDKGNIAHFYRVDESGGCRLVATLNRRAGPEPGGVGSVYTWDGDAVVTAWAVENGYRCEIGFATGAAGLAHLETELNAKDMEIASLLELLTDFGNALFYADDNGRWKLAETDSGAFRGLIGRLNRAIHGGKG